MNFRKGEAGVAEATAFINAFPLDDSEGGNVVLVSAFDRWAIDEGLIRDMVERDTRNTERNTLRNKINHTAASPAWVSRSLVPFHIAVHVHGDSYIVQRTDKAFIAKAQKLPAQIKSIVQTKQSALRQLQSSLDTTTLTLGAQMRISMLETSIRRFANATAYGAGELDREFRSVQSEVARLLAQKPALNSPALDSFLQVDGDDDEADDE